MKTQKASTQVLPEKRKHPDDSDRVFGHQRGSSSSAVRSQQTTPTGSRSGVHVPSSTSVLNSLNSDLLVLRRTLEAKKKAANQAHRDVELFQSRLSDQKRKRAVTLSAIDFWKPSIEKMINKDLTTETKLEGDLRTAKEKSNQPQSLQDAKVIGALVGELTYLLASVRSTIKDNRSKLRRQTEEYDNACAEFDSVSEQLKDRERSLRQADTQVVEVKKRMKKLEQLMAALKQVSKERDDALDENKRLKRELDVASSASRRLSRVKQVFHKASDELAELFKN